MFASIWRTTPSTTEAICSSSKTVRPYVALRFNPVETLVYVGAPTAAVLLSLSMIFEGGDIIGGQGGALLMQRPLPFLVAFGLSFLVSGPLVHWTCLQCATNNEWQDSCAIDCLSSISISDLKCKGEAVYHPLICQHSIKSLLKFCSPISSAQVNLSAYFAIQSTSSLTFKVAGCLKNVAVILYGVIFMFESVTLFQFLFGYGGSIAGFALYTHTQLRKTKAW